MTQQQALAEYMAAAAARTPSEAEAEALAGAATVASLSAADQRALRQVLPHLVRGTAVLTRMLRRRAATREAVRAVPTIMRQTGSLLARRAASTGRPPTRRTVARVAAVTATRVLGNPRTCARTLQRNRRAAQTVTRSNRRPQGQRRVTG